MENDKLILLLIISICRLHYCTSQNITRNDTNIWNVIRKTGRQVIIPPLITLEPTEFTVQNTIAYREGESFTLPCAASGIPEPTYSWKWNEREYDPSGMDGRVAIQPRSGTLIFANPIPLDEAIYQCLAENQAGIATTIKVNVRLARLDSFPFKPVQEVDLNVGESLKLSCLPPRSYPNPLVYWVIQSKTEPFRPIDLTSRISIDPIGNLIFSNVVKGDEHDGAIYYCVASNDVMRGFKKGEPARLSIMSGTRNILHAPEIAWHSPTQQAGLRGGQLTIKCIFYGNPTPRVTWKRVDKKKMPVNVKEFSFGQELKFMNLDYEDAGFYECEGINDEGMVPVRRSFDLKVESTPYWVEKPVSLDVSENETAVYKCSGEGIPTPDILWYINGVLTTNMTVSKKVNVTKTRLIISNVTIKDSFVIQCNITNKYGYNFTNAYLNVLIEPPIIVVEPEVGQKAAECQTIQIKCDVKGSPKPFVYWTKGTEQLTGGRFEVQPNGNLKITDLSLVDAGTYTCTAKNMYGVAEASGFLIVRRRTKIVTHPMDMMVHYEKEAKFRCTATTDPEEIENLVINWKKHDTLIDYLRSMRMYRNFVDNSLTISGTIYLDTGKFTCHASNGIDSAEASAHLIVQAPPDPPNHVQVRCFNKDNTAEIWWQPGKENFAPILNFIVQFNSSFQPDLWYNIAVNVSQNQRRIVANMSAWGNYSFRVLARNKIGLSLPSIQSFNICTTQPNVPTNNPENIIGEGDEPGNLVIFWTPMPLLEHNGPDFKYIVTWVQLNGTDQKPSSKTIGTKAAWHYIVKNRYEPYEPFNVSVRVVNSMGTSLANTSWVLGYSGEDIPKVTPLNLRIVNETLSSMSANLTWDKVENNPRMILGKFRGYRVEFAPSHDYPLDVRFQDMILHEALHYPRKRIMKREAISHNISMLVDKLPPNTEVTAVVRILNKYYAGPASDPVIFRTPEGVPGPPELLSVMVQGATHFVVKWSPPKEINGVLKGYKMNYQSIDQMNFGRLQYYDTHIPPNSVMAKATGLNPDTSYRIYLSGFTATGTGDPIFVDSKTSLSGYPDPPTFTLTDMNQTFANISWIPSRSGTPGSVFYVQYRPRIHYDWLRSPDEYMNTYLPLLSLDPGTTYQVRVVAKNGDGFEAPAVWQEFTTPGVAPGRFDLKISGWFYGIWISLFLILLLIILIMVMKTYTDERWDEKENEIEEEMRRLQAEEAAKQMGLYNMNTETNADEFLEEQKMTYKDERDSYMDAQQGYNQGYPSSTYKDGNDTMI